MHFTTTYLCWPTQAGRLLGQVTVDLLERSEHRSVQSLDNDLRKWVKARNEIPKTVVWTMTGEQIFDSLGPLLKRLLALDSRRGARSLTRW
jgi:hypothetical protein